MLRLPLSQAQVVQKNCSGLIPKALAKYTQLGSALAAAAAAFLEGEGALSEKKKKEEGFLGMLL